MEQCCGAHYRDGTCLSGRGGGAFHGLQYSSVAPVSPIYTVAAEKLVLLVEHDGLWILVHHLSHVPQNVLLGYDAQQTPEQTHREGNKQGQRSAQVRCADAGAESNLPSWMY